MELNKDIISVYNWLNSNKLILNTSKSQIMIIYPELNLLMPQLNVDCSVGSIKIAKKVKCFGVIIDNKLNFKDQINFVKAQISRSVGILDKLKYYLDLTSLLKLYYALIYSHINYGLIIWRNTYSSYPTKLTILRNMEIRIVNNCSWYTTTIPLHKKYNTLSLSQLIKFEIVYLFEKPLTFFI